MLENGEVKASLLAGNGGGRGDREDCGANVLQDAETVNYREGRQIVRCTMLCLARAPGISFSWHEAPEVRILVSLLHMKQRHSRMPSLSSAVAYMAFNKHRRVFHALDVSSIGRGLGSFRVLWQRRLLG